MGAFSKKEALKPSDFSIGTEFEFPETHLKCRVTDIGTRTISYIHLDQEDPANYNGPPYGVAEHVLDEYELEYITILSNTKDIVINLNDNEYKAAEELSKTQELSMERVFKQALKIYQLHCRCIDSSVSKQFTGGSKEASEEEPLLPTLKFNHSLILDALAASMVLFS